MKKVVLWIIHSEIKRLYFETSNLKYKFCILKCKIWNSKFLFQNVYSGIQNQKYILLYIPKCKIKSAIQIKKFKIYFFFEEEEGKE